MRNIFTFVLIIGLAAIMNAQERVSVKFSPTELGQDQLTLTQNWKSYISGNSLMIFNGNIRNASNINSKRLFLNLYLVLKPADIASGSFQGYHVAQVPFDRVPSNSTLSQVDVRGAITDIPPEGDYESILVLTDRGGSIYDVKKVEYSSIESRAGKLAVHYDPIPEVEPVATRPPAHVKQSMDLQEDTSIQIQKEWKIEIDFKDWMVNMVGGDIANMSNEDLKNVKIDLFLTKDDQSVILSDFQGIRIASAVLGTVEKNKKYIDTTIKTNLEQAPKNGTYHILMTLTANDSSGAQVVKTKRAFAETISF
ncbi:MAG: hypothetical protein WDA08_00480 [Weeksellaceae bacterium]